MAQQNFFTCVYQTNVRGQMLPTSSKREGKEDTENCKPVYLTEIPGKI